MTTQVCDRTIKRGSPMNCWESKGSSRDLLEDLIVRLFKNVPIAFMDRIVLWAQRAAAYFGSDSLELDLWNTRVEYRRRFETALVKATENRLHQHVASALGFYRQAGHIVGPDQSRIIFSRLVRSLAADSALVETMAGLQKLPIGRKAAGLRIAAIDEGVHRYLPDIADQAAGELPPLPDGYSFVEDELTERVATTEELAAPAKRPRCKPTRKRKSKPAAKRTGPAKSQAARKLGAR